MISVDGTFYQIQSPLLSRHCSRPSQRRGTHRKSQKNGLCYMALCYKQTSLLSLSLSLSFFLLSKQTHRYYFYYLHSLYSKSLASALQWTFTVSKRHRKRVTSDSRDASRGEDKDEESAISSVTVSTFRPKLRSRRTPPFLLLLFIF